MDAEFIIQDLKRRFSLPLPEFYRRRIIFWHDEDREFEDQIDEIQLDNAKIVKLTGSNLFAVKKLLQMDDRTSNYLVYCPVAYAKAEDNWLLNIELYSGESFRADQSTIWMDEMGLPSSSVLRAQVKRYRKFFGSKDRRAKTAARADNITNASQLHLAVMSVITDAEDMTPGGILRAVLSGGLNGTDNAAYQGLVRYNADAPFWALVSQATGYSPAVGQADAEKIDLTAVAAVILLTAATRTMHREFFDGLDGFISTAHQSFCYDFVSDWMRSGNLRDFYEIARAVEGRTRLFSRFSGLAVKDLRDTECFPCINELILMKMMTEIRDHSIHPDEIIQTAEKRRTMVWYDVFVNYYEGLTQTAKMQSFCFDHAKGFHDAKPEEVWKAYTTDYYRMDTFYRVFHRCFQQSLKSSNDLLDDLFKQVAERVEAIYSGWYLDGLGENWCNAAEDALCESGSIPGVPRQEDFYKDHIRGSDSRAVVIISDALRYEVAVSLAEQLRRETQSKVEISGMSGIFPTTTPFGMAALLPHKTLTIVKRPGGGISVTADGQPTDSPCRDKILKSEKPASVAVQYKNIIGMKKAERNALVKGMDVVYIYHDRIDEAAHTLDSNVFPACEDAVEELKNLVRIVVNDFNTYRIYITADHGFLYTYSPLTEDDKVSRESWMGKEVDYGRRYAIMEKDVRPDYLLPIRFLDGKTDFAAFSPRENIRIKMNGGGLNFVHGGISLQEMVVPLIEYRYLRTDSKAYQRNRARIDTKPVTLSIVTAGRKISNMIFNLTFYQTEPVGDNREKASYSLTFTDSSGKAVSDTVRIIADKTSTNTQDRTFRCTFNLKSIRFNSKESYYLVIADDSGLQLPVREEYHIDIAFAVDEFNFFG